MRLSQKVEVEPADSSVVFSSDETREALQDWSKHDDDAERFCEVDGTFQSISRTNKSMSEQTKTDVILHFLKKGVVTIYNSYLIVNILLDS